MLDRDISTTAALAHLSRPETDPNVLDRRRFLQLVGMGAGAGLVAGGTGSLLDGLLLPGHDPAAWAAGPIGPNDGILVVMGMYGGNDGLDTVVPLGDGNYQNMHGELAIDAESTLSIDGEVGLNPYLTELKRFWDAGSLAIIDGIGYPDPDLSHFNSMGYWMAGRPHVPPSSGWLGRWLDGHLNGAKDLFVAAEIGYSLPLHLVGRQQRGTVVTPNRPAFGAGDSPRDLRQYAALNSLRDNAGDQWSSAVSQAFVDQLSLASALAPFIPQQNQLPGTAIAAGLEIAARIINANLGFRVLSAGWGDFDSHAGQPIQHATRMQEFNSGVRRFFELLDPAWKSRVTVMTFSEFGRTPWNNDGLGTDHGTSAPHFVFGQNVRGGRYGQQPSLTGLGRWDRLEHHVDFRSYFASVIDGWMGGGSADILGSTFENLGLFHGGPGTSGAWPVPPPVVLGPPTVITALQPFRVADTRTGLGEVPTRKLREKEIVKVRVAGVGGVPATGCRAVIANVTAVDATTAMHFTVFPGGTPRPPTANLNGRPGRPVPNLVVMGVGSDGTIEVYNSHGETHCVVDVFGYATIGGGDRFVPVQPARLFDTRDGTGVRAGKILDRVPVDIEVAGHAGVPASGATAVVMNLAVTEPESRGYLRVTPKGAAVRETANVNFFPGDTVPNLVICKLGDGGQITIDGRGDGSHAVGDVFGWFGVDGDRLQILPPSRVLDTRDGTGAPAGQIGPSRGLTLELAGRAGIPDDATAVVLNVAATNVAARSYVSVFPAGEAHPGTANLNVVPDRNIANLVICRLGDGGGLRISNRLAQCDVVADVFGYFVD